MSAIRVLLVENNRVDQLAFQAQIEANRLPYEYEIADSSAAVRSHLAGQTFDLAMVRASLDTDAAIDLMPTFTTHRIPVIVVVESGAEDTVATWMQHGAKDYLIRDDEQGYLKLLPIVVDRVWACTQCAAGAQWFLEQFRHDQSPQWLALPRSHLAWPTDPITRLQIQTNRDRLISKMVLNIRQSLNLQEILDAIVSDLQDVLVADRVLAYCINQADGSGIVLAESVLAPWQSLLHQTIRDEYFAENLIHAYQDGRIQVTHDVHAGELEDCHVEFLERLQVQAILVIPVVANHQLWGLLVVQQCAAPRQWQQAEIELLQLLSNQITIAIHQGTLYEQAQTELRERQRAEQSLQQAEAFQRAILSHSSDVVLLTDDTGRLTYISANAESVFGYSRADLPELEHIEQVLGGSVVDLDQLVAQDEIPNIEQTILDRQGRTRFLLITVKRVAIAQSTVLYTCRDVTEYRQTQAALAASEQQLRTIIATIPDGILIVDLQGHILFANSAAERLADRSVTELLNQELGIPITDGDTVQELGLVQSGFKQVRLTEMRTALMEWNGEDVYLVSLTDVMHRRQTEAKLQASIKELEDFRYALDRSASVVIADTQGTIIYTNSNFCQVSQYTQDDLLGQNWQILDSSFHPPEVFQTMRHTIAQGQVWRGEMKSQAKDGRYYWLDMTIVPFLDNHQKPYQYLAIGWDITDRKTAEQQITFQASLLNQVRNAVVAVNLEGQITYWNHHAEVMYQWTAAEVVGRNLLEVLQVRQVLTQPLAVLETIRDKGYWEGEFEVYRQDGSCLFVHTIDSLIRDEAGVPIGFAGVSSDISDRKQQERLLLGQQQVLELLARESSLAEVLELLTQIIEAQSTEGALVSVLLLEEGRLWNGAAPSLPARYNQAINGLVIGPQVGSCGTAAYRRETVIVTDIALDPLWQDFRELALDFDLHACSSIPIFSSTGSDVLGTFAIYYRQPRMPSYDDLQLVNLAVNLAGLAIERKRTEAALRRSESKHRALIAALPDLVMRVSRDGTYLDFFPAKTFKTLGDATLVGTKIYNGYLPETVVCERMAAIQQALETGEIQVWEQHLEIEQDWRTEEVRVAVCGPDEVLILIRDITDRKRVEVALRKSEETNRALIQALPDLLIRMRQDGTYLDVRNRHNLPLIGDCEILPGKEIQSRLPIDLFTQRLEIAQWALASQEVQTYEQEILVETGEVRYEEVRVAPCGDEEVLVIVRDISDRKQAEQSLQNLVEGAAAVTGDNFLPIMSDYIAAALNVRYVLVLAQLDSPQETFSQSGPVEYRFWINGQLQPEILHSLADLPCGRTMTDGIYCCPEQLHDQFPNTPFLNQLGVVSYLGIALTNPQGDVIGSLCILDDHPIQQTPRAIAILRVFAARVSTELGRQAAIEALHHLNQDLERRVEERTLELRRTNVQLRHAIAERQRLAAVVENSTDCIVMATQLGHLLYLNQAGRCLLGIATMADITDFTLADFHFPEDWPELQKTVMQTLRHGEPWQGEMRLRHVQSGEAIPMLYSAFPVKQAQTGETIAIAGILRDMTERQRVEQQLRDLSDRLTLAVKSGGFGIWEYDFAQDRLLWDERMYDLYGIDPSQFAGNHAAWVACLHPEDREDALAAGQQAKLGEADYDTDFRVVHADGSIHFIKAYGSVQRDSQGELLRVIGVNFDMTKLKQAEIALQQSEARNRAILEAIPDLLLRLRRDGTCLDCIVPNHTEAEEFLSIQQNIAQTLPPEILHQQLAAIEQAILTQELQVYEHQFLKQGQLIYEEVRVVAINQDEALVIVRNITARKQAELALQESQYFVQRIAEASPNILYIYDLQEQRSVYINRPIATFLHLALDNHPGEAHDFLTYAIHPDDRAMVDLHHQRLAMARDTDVLELEYRLQDAAGGWCWFARRDTVFARDAAHRVTQIIGTAQDITMRKQTELVLHQQLEKEQLFIAIMQRIRDSLDLKEILATTVQEVRQLMQVDRVLAYQIFDDGRGEVVSEAVVQPWRSLMQVQFPAEAFPSDCYDRYIHGYVYVLHDRELSPILDCMAQFMDDFHIRSKLVIPIVQQDPQKLWGLLIAHECSCSRMWQAGEVSLLQQLAGQLAIAIQQAALYHQLQSELVERQRAEKSLYEVNERLQLTNAELARATRLKDEFLANMSHELRTPLNAVLGMAEGLQDHAFGELNDRQKRACATITRSGKHLLDLINDILDLAKIEAGKLELQIALTSVQNLCASSLSFVRQVAHKKNLQLQVLLPPTAGMIQVDERRLRQVLINLLSNAVKFTPEGGTVTLRVTILTTPRQIQFEVRDTGIGIAPENLPKLFQSFVQIDSNLNRQYPGTGLGLALVKRIVELHKGSIQVESVLDQGTCFTVRVPVQEETNPLPQQQGQLEAPQPLQESGIAVIPAKATKPLILLAEDNLANIDTFSNYLSGRGYELILANNGKRAIEMAQMHHPSLILMDIQMPDVDGIEAMQQIRQISHLADVPIIALTALAMPGDRERCLAAGANEYLTKPVSLRHLANTIYQLLTL